MSDTFEGYRIFGSLEDPGGCYSFDTLMVWERIADGALFYASDAGCSCPSPFEDTTLEDLTEITDTQEAWVAFTEYLAQGCWDKADCGELAGKVSMQLANQADARRRGAGYVSTGALRDAKARIASLEAALAAAQEQAKKSGAEHRAAVQAHKRLCDMLLALGKEIDLYMETEAPKDTITIRVNSERTNRVGAA